ncbi:14430_t:CDS:2, partial [Racocetra fulgida]
SPQNNTLRTSNNDNNNSTSPKIAESPIESDNESDNVENNNYKESFNFEYDIAMSDKDIQSDNNANYVDAEPKDFVSNNSKDVVNNPIQKLF